jgi:hypothetical protein
MGFYQTRKMAVCFRYCLLIFFSMSLVILYYTYQERSKEEILINKNFTRNLQPIHLKIQYWVQTSRQFQLSIVRFRPHPSGGYDIWFKGQYAKFLAFMKLLMTENPEISCRRIMLELTGDNLMIQMEVL